MSYENIQYAHVLMCMTPLSEILLENSQCEILDTVAALQFLLSKNPISKMLVHAYLTSTQVKHKHS